MKINRIIPLCIFLISFHSGCKTTHILKPDKQVTVPAAGTEGEFRGFTVLPADWISDDSVTMRKNISSLIEKAAEANYNSVFFFVSGNTEAVFQSPFTQQKEARQKNGNRRFDPLKAATEKAHKYNLKIYAGINLAEFVDKDSTLLRPLVITRAKNRIRNLITGYDIEGLSLVSDENYSYIIEDLVVEAMLIKPYLVNSIIYPGANGYKNAAGFLEKGIADLIFPQTGLSATDPAKSPYHYEDRTKNPDHLKKITSRQVVGLDLSALFPDNPGGQTVYIDNRSRTRITDSEGNIGFITSHPDTIKLETAVGSYILSTESWSIPYKYALTPDNRVLRKAPWIEFRRMPEKYTDIPDYDLLCKTEYPATVRINNDSIKQYKTGIFFNKITLKEGPNRIRATALTPDSLSAFYEEEFIYHKTDKTRKPFPLWINERTIEPSSDLELLPEDKIRVSFQGSLGQEGYIEIMPGRIKIRCSREDHEDYSLYKGEIASQKLKAGKPVSITLRLIPADGVPDKGNFEFTLKQSVIVREASDFPYVKIVKENSRLVYNLGAPRLGGPIRSELGPGVVLKTNGRTGDNYRVRLSSTENGYINKNDVQLMPAGTVQPFYYISSMSCSPSGNADILTIPYPEPVPWEVYPDPEQNRIVITLFGVETSSTWITHLAGRRIIDKITWQQTTPETYQIYINLKTPEIWGYSIRTEGKRLVLRLRYPPEYNLNAYKPLTGLKIAIEAGHGGSGTGAIGLSGLVEKDINLDLSFRLGELCKSMGAEILQVRDSDKDMGLIEKRDIAQLSDADLLICIHANAGGRGYLQVAGTSTYYNNPFWAPLAESIYDRLLELKLKEFGVVGSFNYTVIRVSQMPSILVEQAFMTNAEDEEKLFDPEFRQQMAQKIYEGIIDYLGHRKQYSIPR